MPSKVARRSLLVPLTLLALLASLLQAPAAHAAVMFTVDSIGDGSDSNPSDNICDDGTGFCTLRAAIEQANATAGADIIDFALTGGAPYAIAPASPLPAITESVAIDGTTQAEYAGAPVIHLDGTSAGSGDGLRVQSADVTITALSITDFPGIGISVDGGDNAHIDLSYLGVNPDGATGNGNGGNGATISNSSGVEISGSVISGNAGQGISSNTADGASIHDDIIGLNAAGTDNFSNAGNGIEDYASSGMTIGPFNTISGNDDNGVRLIGTTDANVVGNTIGLAGDGVTPLGNASFGIQLVAWHPNPGDNVGTVVGGTGATDPNVIGGNGYGGISIFSQSGPTDYFVHDAAIQGNSIGVTGGGDPAPNGSGAGISVTGDGGSYDILIGGTGVGEGNTIANDATGISIGAATGSSENHGVTISGNYIHGATGLGIDLQGGTEDAHGVTANDANDTDTGPNGLQNYPELGAATATDVPFTLDSAGSTDYRVEFFANAGCDVPSGYGEGDASIGSTDVTTGPGGSYSGSLVLASPSPALPDGTVVTATATALNGPTAGDTSEFSACATVMTSTDLSAAIGGQPAQVTAGQPLSFSADVTNEGPSDTSDVVTTITAPAGADTIVATPPAGTVCDPPAAGEIVCTTSSLIVSESVSIPVSVRSSTTPGLVSVAAAITSSATSDPAPANDTDSKNVDVLDATPGFAPATSYDLTGGGAHSVVTGPFDGDAHPDVVVTNPAAGTASILLGSASGDLGTASPITLAGTPRWIATGRIDAGATEDLLVNTEDCTGPTVSCGTLTFAAGDGYGGFAAPVAVDVSNAPQGIALHDVNDDGKLDLLAADRVGADLSVSLGNGNGTFGAATTYGTVGNQYGIEVADLNADGALDIVTTSAVRTVVFLGNETAGSPDGTFAAGAASTIASGSAKPWPRILDLNDDTHPDIAVSGNAQTLLNQGDGTFAATADEQLATASSFLAKGDFNKDGQPDLEASASGTTPPTPDLLQLRGDGEGTFNTGPTGLLQYRVTNSIDAGDLNGDGTRDLILPNGGDDKVTILIAVPNPGLAAPSISHAPEPQQAGFSSIPTDSLDFSGVSLVDGTLETSAGPLSAPIPSKPIPSKPIPSKPIPSKPIPSKPIPSKGVGAPSPLSAIPLSSLIAHDLVDPPLLTQVGIDIPGGWTQVLTDAGSPLANQPLQDVNFNQVLGLTGVKEITLDHFDFSQTGLGSLPPSAFFFGETPLSDIGLPAGTTWNGATGLLSQMTDPDGDAPCVGTISTSNLSQTLVDLALARCLLAVAPWPDMTLRTSTLTAANAPLSSLLFTGIDVTKVSYTLGGDTVSLADLPLDQVPGGIVNCSAMDCTAGTGQTLGDAQAADDILDTATFGMLFGGGAAVIGDMTLGQLLLGVVQPDGFPYENVSLESLLAAATPGLGGSVAYTVTFDVNCPVPSDTEVRMRLPNGQFGYVSGTAEFTFDGGPPVGAGKPVKGPSGRLTWPLPDSATVCGAGTDPVHVVLTFNVQPSPSIGSFTSSVAIRNTDGDTVRAKDPALLTLTPANEPNDTPASAISIAPDTLYTGTFSSTTDVDYYEIPVGPGDLGSLVTVYLSHMSSDDDLVIYGSAPESLAAAPIPSKPIPSKSVGDQEGCLPSGYVLQPQTLDDVPQVTTTGRAVRGFSTNRSSQEEVVCTTVQVADIGHPLLIQVSHNSGPIDGDTYVARFTVTPPPGAGDCQGPTFDHPGDGSQPSSAHTTLANQVVPVGTTSLILFNGTRFGDMYGAGAEAATLTKLESLAAATDGRIVALESSSGVSTAYGTLDASPCSPEAANGVVRSINQVVQAVTTGRPTPEYIVVVGDDDQIPFARLQDLTTLGNQFAYSSNLQFDGFTNPTAAAFARGMFLSDDPYSSLSPAPWIGNLVYIPDIALGRLVETPAEIQGQIDQFLGHPSGLDPKTALVTGTDFSKDVATQILGDLTKRASDLNAATSTTAYSAKSLNDDSWTRLQMICRLDGSNLNSGCSGATPEDFTPPGIISMNGHFDHYRALPGDVGAGGLLSSTDFVDSKAAAGSLLFTIGCNSGVNLPDAYVSSPGSPSRSLDWAQALAQKQGTLVANNGFGYGDTTRIAYSERLMKLFANRLDGGFTIGKALREAKSAYWLELATYSPYDIKSLEESTFYGLPMYAISGTGTPGGVTPPTIGTDPATALRSADVSLPQGTDPYFVDPSVDRRSTPTGDYFVGPRTQVITGFPIEPISNPFDMTPAAGQDLRMHGAIVTKLTTQDFGNFDPVVGSTQLNGAASGVEPTIAVGISPTDFLTTSFANGRDSLVLYGGRFTANAATPGRGTQRIYTQMSTRAFYAPLANTDFTPPNIVNNTGELLTGGFATFGVSTTATDVAAAYVMYLPTGAPQFKLQQLSPTTGGRYQATVSAPTGVSEFFTQIVDTSGNVAIDTFKGSALALQLPPSPPPGITTTIIPDAGTTVHNGWYSGPATVRITANFYLGINTGLDGVTANSGVFVVNVPVPGTDGVHRVDYSVGSFFSSAVVVPVDKTPPTISRIIGDVKYEPGEAVPPFVSAGASITVNVMDQSGIASCSITVDGPGGYHTTPSCGEGDNLVALGGGDGQYTVVTTATDNAGNTVTVPYQFSARKDSTPPTITPGIGNPQSPVFTGSNDPIYVKSTSDLTMTVADPGFDAGTGSGVKDCTTTLTSNPGQTCAAGLNTYHATGADGPRTLTTTARDNVLNQSTRSVNVIVDNTAPVITQAVQGTDAAGDDTVFRSGGTTWMTSGTTFAVGVSDPMAGTAPGSGVNTCTTSATGSGVVTPANCATTGASTNLTGPDAAYTLTTSAADKVTNASSLSTNATLDNTPPIFGRCPGVNPGISANLASGITATATSLTVNETASPPHTRFVIVVDPGTASAETVLVTKRVRVGSSTTQFTYTATRGFGGGTKFAHAANAPIKWNLPSRQDLLGTPPAALGATATTFTLKGERFGIPSTPFMIIMDNEQMLVTTATPVAPLGNYSLTVVRGYNGTTGAAHTTTSRAIWSGAVYGLLNAGPNATATTVTMNEGRFGPAGVPFEIFVGTEQMTVVKRVLVSGTQYTYTVARGIDGTKAAAHAAGEAAWVPAADTVYLNAPAQDLSIPITDNVVTGVTGSGVNPVVGPAGYTTSTLAPVYGSLVGGTGSFGFRLTPSAVGTFPLTINAKDNVGNASVNLMDATAANAKPVQIRCWYEVIYKFNGFFKPENDILNSQKAGSGVPVKWLITDYNGVPITDSDTFVEITASGPKSCDTVPEYAVVEQQFKGGSDLQNLGGGNYQFNWATKKSYASTNPKCRTMSLRLAASGLENPLPDSGSTMPPPSRRYEYANFTFK